MSSPKYVERRGILASAVAAKAQLYRSVAHRSLLFFLQGLSMKNGGLRAVAADLFSMFPGRIGKCDGLTRAQHADLLELLLNDQEDDAHRRALQIRWFSEFLELLCIDPSIDIEEISANKVSTDAPYFRDPIGAIMEYRKRRNASILASHVVTSIGSDVHRWLNRALCDRTITIIEGPSGAGKTNAAKLWCKLHPGEARFVTLSGITHRTGLFQKIGTALGLGICQHASSKLQAKIEAHLAMTKLMLVLDEAHYLWPQRKRSHSPPELIDWIDTIVNLGVPVALICTDQFAKLKSHVEKQTGWTSDQFIHRTCWKETIEKRPTKEDLRSVTGSLLSHRWNESHESWVFDSQCHPDQVCVNAIATYSQANVLPLPSVRNTVREARVLARERGGFVVSARDVKHALEARQRADVSIRTTFGAKAKKSQQRRQQSYLRAESPDLSGQEQAVEQEQITNFRATAPTDSRRFHTGNSGQAHRSLARGRYFLRGGDLDPHPFVFMFRTWDIPKADKLSAKLQYRLEPKTSRKTIKPIQKSSRAG